MSNIYDGLSELIIVNGDKLNQYLDETVEDRKSNRERVERLYEMIKDKITEERPVQQKLDYISSKAPIVSSVDGKIELDPNNPLHREWYEEEY